jgi:leucyl aminopeptidase
MTDLTFAIPDEQELPLTALTPDTFEIWKEGATPARLAWAKARNFKAGFGDVLVLPGSDGSPASALVGLGSEARRRRKRFAMASARAALPAVGFRLTNAADIPDLSSEMVGWLLAGYRFTKYRTSGSALAQLVAPTGIDVPRIEATVAGEALTRNLINTPANDMGPAELEDTTRTLATGFGASVTTIEGDALRDSDLGMIHAVGAASPRAPRLIDMTWGQDGPKLTLVGKGVCFDTGGLNLKPGGSMALMKKDMGGAATVLGLAHMIMAMSLPVRLRVLIPAVENSVSGLAFRPGDILKSRKGLTVEINNTDAEGRLVLADALTLASEEQPDLIVSMATLTGAARVAVGPDLAPFYTDDDGLAATLTQGAAVAADPVWRLPFWDPYEAMIEPAIADLDNAPSGGFAGSITAALFLRRFVADSDRYVHFDIFGWQPTAAPGRPKGGVGQGARALFEALPEVLDL